MRHSSDELECCDALVIGAGFFGVEIALELRRLGLRRVVIVDREPGIMRRASFVNQARVHNGYHYPRHLRTAARSSANFEAFAADYAYAVVDGLQKVYAIAAGSTVSPGQFESFCRVLGVQCRPAPHRLAALFDVTTVQDAFLVHECAFDAARLAARLRPALHEAGVEVRLGTRATVLGAGADHVVVEAGPSRLRAHHVVNCTYAGLEDAGITLRSRIRRELAELVLIEPPPELRGVGVTVMDGPFFSTMPFPAAAGLHSLSHVRYTPHAATEQIASRLRPKRSHATAMLRDSQRYLPCLARATVAGSLFEIKATLARNEADDGRPILIERSAAMPRVLSVLGAKIDNVYDIRAYLRGQDWRMAA